MFVSWQEAGIVATGIRQSLLCFGLVKHYFIHVSVCKFGAKRLVQHLPRLAVSQLLLAVPLVRRPHARSPHLPGPHINTSIICSAAIYADKTPTKQFNQHPRSIVPLKTACSEHNVPLWWLAHLRPMRPIAHLLG